MPAFNFLGVIFFCSPKRTHIPVEERSGVAGAPKKGKEPMNTTERTRRFRARSKAGGWRIVAVRVPAERADEVRVFARSLGKPPAPIDPNQAHLFSKESTDV